MKLYLHPFSSYSQKVLIALYENATPFEYRTLEDADAGREFAALTPTGRFPILVDDERAIFESTAIIEYLQLHNPGPVRFIPTDGDAAIDVRMLDRFFDNYVMTPMQAIVFDFRKPEAERSPRDVSDAHALLERAYDWLERYLAGREWACDSGFGLADCAAAPSLFYADWVHDIGDARPNLLAYRERLLARPSFARAVDEARPFRHYFPPGAPDRD